MGGHGSDAEGVGSATGYLGACLRRWRSGARSGAARAYRDMFRYRATDGGSRQGRFREPADQPEAYRPFRHRDEPAVQSGGSLQSPGAVNDPAGGASAEGQLLERGQQAGPVRGCTAQPSSAADISHRRDRAGKSDYGCMLVRMGLRRSCLHAAAEAQGRAWTAR